MLRPTQIRDKRMKKILLLTLLVTCSLILYGQTTVHELYYNVDGDNYSALCVLNGEKGKCRVLSDVGNCWYDAKFTDYGSYSAIKIYNPKSSEWIPVTFYITPDEKYLVVEGEKFALKEYIIPQSDWNKKKAHYGFRIDGQSSRNKKGHTRGSNSKQN